MRELAQALSVAVVLAEGGVIDLQHLPEALRAPAAPPAPKEAPALSPEDEKLRAALIAELEARAGNISEVARSFGKTRMQIHRWMHRFGVDGASYRRGGAG
ncbi:MAG: hypothetical protein U0359_27685 [Byssovorax sp.]